MRKNENIKLRIKNRSYKSSQSLKDNFSILGHYHGVLWVNLSKLENLVHGPDGSLINGTEEQVKSEKFEKPLTGVSEAFRKLKNDFALNEQETSALTCMIEEFTTVSLHGNSVGHDVVKIVTEVNVHHHTRSCRKYNEMCRFNYPRFPCHKTIIAKPLKGRKEEIKELTNKYETLLKKVREILLDEEKISEIMNGYVKSEETTEEHKKCVEERIKKLCRIVGVTTETYLEALSFSRRGYTIIQRRDIDETYVNSYNKDWIRRSFIHFILLMIFFEIFYSF